MFPSVLWCCWLGGRKGIRPVKTEWWMHLAPDRQPCQQPITQFLQAWCHSYRPTNSIKALKTTQTDTKILMLKVNKSWEFFLAKHIQKIHWEKTSCVKNKARTNTGIHYITFSSQIIFLFLGVCLILWSQKYGLQICLGLYTIKLKI